MKTLTGLCPNQRDPHCRAKNADFQDAMDGNRTYQMSQWLSARPYLALNPTEKTEILAHLCNDLLQNKAVLRQVGCVQGGGDLGVESIASDVLVVGICVW